MVTYFTNLTSAADMGIRSGSFIILMMAKNKLSGPSTSICSCSSSHIDMVLRSRKSYSLNPLISFLNTSNAMLPRYIDSNLPGKEYTYLISLIIWSSGSFNFMM